MKTQNIFFTLLVILFFSLNAAFCQFNIDTETFATGLDQPAEITNAGDNRLFVIEQAGLIRIIDTEGNAATQPFLDITDRVKSGGEQGLLGLAFHPDYNTNGFFYVNYTDQEDSTHIARFSVMGGNPDMADASSEKTLLTVDQPFQNHNGGHLAFGPDGYLYFGLGDGGSGGDPGNRAQNLESYLGKMHRIDVDGGDPYGIPSDNPFVDNPNALDEIWAFGLRNPWRFSFDRETGNLWIGDVGQNQVEEIDLQPVTSSGGENYGWRCYEGSNAYNTNGCGPQSDYVFPIYEYSHSNGCSITGGYVYRGIQMPSLLGYYFYADYCNNKIWILHQEENDYVSELVGQFDGNGFSTFGEDAVGELYIAGHQSGTIYKFKDNTSGVSENSKDQLLVYPNPFHDLIHIAPTSNQQYPIQVKIIDLRGKEFYNERFDPNNGEKINLEFAPAGVYIICIESPDFTIYKKATKLED